MTEYITIYAKKRTFVIPSEMKGLSEDEFAFSPILWDDGTSILWDDSELILWDDEVRLKEIRTKKRNFIINAKAGS